MSTLINNRTGALQEILDYKGYKIKLNCSKHNPMTFKIIKVIGTKWHILRQQTWTNFSFAEATKKATDYIDNFEDRLTEKLDNKLKKV